MDVNRAVSRLMITGNRPDMILVVKPKVSGMNELVAGAIATAVYPYRGT